jgi:hypothetical protein
MQNCVVGGGGFWAFGGGFGSDASGNARGPASGTGAGGAAAGGADLTGCSCVSLGGLLLEAAGAGLLFFGGELEQATTAAVADTVSNRPKTGSL